MKDKTKHIIAREIYRLVIAVIACFVLVFIIESITIYIADKDPFWKIFDDEEYMEKYWGFSLLSLIAFYAIRFIRKAFKWVMKWK